MPAHRPMAEEPLLRAEALFLCRERALAHAPRIEHGVAQHAGVGRNLRPGRPAEDPPDRLAQPLALEVPERAVDHAEREHRLALAAVHQQAVDHVPQVLGGERVLPEQHRPQLGRDEVRAGRPERPREAAHALVGLDRQEKRLDLERAVVDLPAVLGEVLLLAERLVDVDRPHQPLLPERPLGRHRAAHLAHPHPGDLHASPPGSLSPAGP